MKKIILGVLFFCLVFTHASSANILLPKSNITSECMGQYCIYIRGDNSLINYAIATMIMEGKADNKIVSESEDIYLTSKQYYLISFDLDDLTSAKIDYLEYKIIDVENQPMSDCKITLMGTNIAPGIHTLIISQKNGRYFCQKVE